MGGDNAPATVVAGAFAALREHGELVRPILVGDRQAILEEFRRLGAPPDAIEIVHAAERVDMDEGGAEAFRRKKDSSLNVATRMVRDGTASGVISAGNTGAMVTASMLNMGRIPGVQRPAIASFVPTKAGRPTLMLDVGATADCKPTHLFQFAILGETFVSILFGIERPRVGLLNIGEESSKGNELAQEAHIMLAASGLEFVGNVEGRDILKGGADVVVTDGFTGNVLLKFGETAFSMVVGVIKAEIGAHILAKLGALLLRPSMRRFKKDFDHTEYGGAPLLGVNGIAIIAHGSSDAKSIKNAIRVAGELSDRGIMNEITHELERFSGGKVANS